MKPRAATRVLPIIRVGALIVAVVIGGIGIVAALTALFADTVTASFPIDPLPIVAPRGVTITGGPDATIVAGGMDHATAQLRGLDVLTRVLLASGTLLYAAMIVVIAIAVSQLARSLRRGNAFHPGAARASVVSALAVFIGGGVGSIVTQLGEWRVSDEALRVWAWEYQGTPAPSSLAEAGWPQPSSVILTVDWWPLLIAFALAAVGIAFRAGEQLRDRAEAAERDTEGLV